MARKIVGSERLSAEKVERIGQVCSHFEAAWRMGQQPRVEVYLGTMPSEDQPALLRELVARELTYRRQAGDQPTLDEYQGRFPEHRDLIRTVFTGPTSPALVPTMTYTPGPETVAPNDPRLAVREERRGRIQRAGEDLTLTYLVTKANGQIEPLLDRERRERLRTSFAPGTLLQGRYLVNQELGRGGMGLVYFGHDERMDRPVAIKVMLPAWLMSKGSATLAQSIDMFSEEARLGANLSHEGITRVFDHGFHEDKLFTVFEYLEGESLRDLLKRRTRLPLEEVIEIVGQVAQALDFAHARYVVHRDLKPENIREKEKGRFMVLDFGLARVFSRVELTGYSGTPAYTSPEQAAVLPIDGRSDQYSLALIAYELLTCRRPFESHNYLGLLEMHKTEPPSPPWGMVPDLPMKTWLVLLRALEKNPDERFDTCSEFAEALGFTNPKDRPHRADLYL
jgi:hypothetical protein